ncbi:MAG: hypothetical protein CL851_03540 [Crocinitomicaceae bacterium]|nr:hypothetical protein [Crocinitomicaceae bacterium]|tara:strand:- start:9465 stop:10544 length:1080 start_codon:yes stop_codon:yes gene_type:complete
MVKINKEEIITSYNLARMCDVVFSEVVTDKQFQSLDIQNVAIMSKSNKDRSHVAESALLYKKKFFNINENDVIFSNLSLVTDLFNLLRKEKKLKNLILVTSQTDIKVDKELFSLKPACISTWYSINVEFEDENLIPIPLGLSNDYSPKNILSRDIIYFPKFEEYDYSPVLYLNFQVNTNKLEREGLNKAFNDLDWVESDNPNLSLVNYKKKLSENKFVLCPIGNGLDTHRIWESLYLGSIPVVENHLTYKTTTNLPVLKTDNLKNIDKEDLINFLSSLKTTKIESDKLLVSYWIKLIRTRQVANNSGQQIYIKEHVLITFWSIFRVRFKGIKEKYRKKMYHQLRKIPKVINKIKKINEN